MNSYFIYKPENKIFFCACECVCAGVRACARGAPGGARVALVVVVGVPNRKNALFIHKIAVVKHAAGIYLRELRER